MYFFFSTFLQMHFSHHGQKKKKKRKKNKWYYNMLFFVLPHARAWWETNIAAWLQVKSRIIYILITKLRLKILFLVR